MSAIATEPDLRPSTEDDPQENFLKMEQHGLFELVDGELIEKPIGSLSGETSIVISSHLYGFLCTSRLGKVYAETAFCCFPKNPGRIRRPDIAFVAKARLSGVPREGLVPIRPDLCIEIVSPKDGVYDLDGNLEDYRNAGVPLTWVFNPAYRIVRIYKPDRSIVEMSETDTIGGEDVLPGFSAVVAELFPEPE